MLVTEIPVFSLSVLNCCLVLLQAHKNFFNLEIFPDCLMTGEKVWNSHTTLWGYYQSSYHTDTDHQAPRSWAQSRNTQHPTTSVKQLASGPLSLVALQGDAHVGLGRLTSQKIIPQQFRSFHIISHIFHGISDPEKSGIKTDISIKEIQSEFSTNSSTQQESSWFTLSKEWTRSPESCPAVSAVKPSMKYFSLCLWCLTAYEVTVQILFFLIIFHGPFLLNSYLWSSWKKLVKRSLNMYNQAGFALWGGQTDLYLQQWEV